MLDCFIDFQCAHFTWQDFLGKPKDFKAFHNSFGLPMHSFNLFSKKFFSYWKSSYVPYVEPYYTIPYQYVI